jgi:hypothetical protein
MTRLRTGRSRVPIPAGARDFFPFYKNIQTGSGPHPASYSMGTGILSFLVLRLRISGTIGVLLLPWQHYQIHMEK